MDDFDLYYQDSDDECEKEKISYTNKDTLFGWLSIVVGFLFVRAVHISENTLGSAIVLILLFLFGLIFAKTNGFPISRSSYAFMAVSMIFSVGFITSANKLTHFLLLVLLVCSFLYWVYSSLGLGEGIFGRHCFDHMIHAIFRLPVGYIMSIFPALLIKDKNKAGGKILRTVLWALAGLACAVIPTAIIILLLSYDKGFTNLLERMITVSPDDIIDLFADLLFGFALAILIFASLFGAKHRHEKNCGEPQKIRPIKSNFLPRALLCAAVTPILAVYILFFISQWNYYVSAFTGVLPGEITYAEYARSGFFQLCAVSAINALMLLLFNVLIKKKERERDVLRDTYSTVISVFTLVLIATAISKMLLYIRSYGLTPKRVYASWFMLMLAVIFIVVLLGQLIRRLPKTPTIAAVVIVSLAIITLPNVEGMIASYNVNAYKTGTLKSVDAEAIYDLDVSGVPAMIELREELSSRGELSHDEQMLLERVDAYLERARSELGAQSKNAFTFNIPSAKARALLDKYYDSKG